MPIDNDELRHKVDSAIERITRMEGRFDGHETLSSQRYMDTMDRISRMNTDILERITRISADLSNISKWGLIMALLLFSIELGKATFPTLFHVLQAATTEGIIK